MSETGKTLVNRVAASGLITLNLEDYFPESEVVEFDLKNFLFKGLILKEKDFRLALREHDWTQYEGKYLALFCSTDAIIPVWAYMLVTSLAGPHARDVFFGNSQDFLKQYYRETINALDVTSYQDKRLVIKGCSGKPVPASAYLDLTRRLRPVALSIMYGEPCSTVPIYKKNKK